MEVAGEIESGEVKSGRKGTKKRKVKVRWTAEDGKPHRQDFTISKTFFEEIVIGDLIVKPDVIVRYAPSDPEGTAILAGGSSHSPGMLWGGVGAAVLGLGICTYGVKKQD